jgi:hypothetical protein
MISGVPAGFIDLHLTHIYSICSLITGRKP